MINETHTRANARWCVLTDGRPSGRDNKTTSVTGETTPPTRPKSPLSTTRAGRASAAAHDGGRCLENKVALLGECSDHGINL